MMYGQMTAGSWIYIGTQGILQGTYETFTACGNKHFNGNLKGKLLVSGGLGGMGGAQPLAATMAGAVFLGADVDPKRIEKRLKTHYIDKMTYNYHEAVSWAKDALKEAAKILIHHFMLFSDERITLETEEKSINEEFDENTLHVRQLLKLKPTDLDLSVRALNCLKAADVETLGELVAYNRNDLLKFRNFGKKSLTELDQLVDVKGLEFGMNVSKYKLDKE